MWLDYQSVENDHRGEYTFKENSDVILVEIREEGIHEILERVKREISISIHTLLMRALRSNN